MEIMTNAASRTILGVTLLSGLAFGLAGCNIAPEKMPKSVLYDKANEAELEGDAQSASDLYRVVALRYPGDWQAKFDTARTLLELNQPKANVEARGHIKISISLKEESLAVRDAWSECEYRAGRSAWNKMFARLDGWSNESALDAVRGAKYATLTGDVDLSARRIEQALEQDVNCLDAYLAAVDLAEVQDDDNTAKYRTRQAYGLAPEDPRVVAKTKAYGLIVGPTLAVPPGL
ncbi:MAG: hypothetical protein CMH41_00340 [Micrococcales bacterium]|nr:hypothetical protein [Micrococcales bacterium]